MLALALASGGTAAFLALRYLRQQATPLMAAQPKHAQVVVAAKDLPVGTVLGERDLKTIEWIGGSVPLGFVGSPQQAVNRGLIVAVAENEPILEGKLAGQGMGGGLPVIIEPGMRALSIAVDQIVGVAGFVTPTTRVDVLLTMNNAPGASEPVTKVIMQNVRTLAAGQSIQQDKEGKAQPVGVVTMLLSPEQAETLALATRQGSIQLALRNMLDTVHIETKGARSSTLMGRIGAAVAARPGPRRAAAVQAAVPEPAATVVEVYRGGQRTLQKF
jgi:pilus assembly protein CpaB